MTQRHFAKVLNSIDVGIAGDRLESSLLQLKVFVPSYGFHFVLFFCCESADVDLEYFCCPVWMVCWSFSVFRDGVLSFSVSVLWSVFVMFDWWTLLDDVDQEIDSFWTFRCLTVISVVHMDAYMLTVDTQVAVAVSFCLHVATTCFQETFLGNET